MVRVVLNDEHLEEVLREGLDACRQSLLIATADVKDLHIPVPMPLRRRGRGRARSIVQVLRGLCERGVEVRLMHSGVPSGPFLQELKQGIPEGFTMRRCPRLHAKAMIVDGRWMYIGSANLTGAGLGAKSAKRRNFEAGIWTDEETMIDSVADMLDGVWSGRQCPRCGRQEYCPVPLEEPQL